MRWINLRALLIGLVVTGAACSQPAAVEIDSLEDRVDSIFADFDDPTRPGYSIGVVRHGQLILARGYGAEDIEIGLSISPDTAFNLASLSKQFTGAALALELQNGQLRLEDRLADHWNELPGFMRDIKLGHLVYMTSGLQEYYTLPSSKGGWDSEDRFDVNDAIDAVFASDKLQYEPGTQWSYSNINYQLLAVLISRINRTEFADHMMSSVFEPLGMTNSWVDAPITQSRSQRATSYVWDDLSGAWRIAPRLSPHYGGSGVFASLRDLAVWDAALYKNDTLGPSFRELMLSTQRFEHAKDNDAFGLVHGSYRGLKTIWYEGGDYGASTYMARLPDRDETVICLANFGQGDCGSMVRSIIDVIITIDSLGH